jgi:transcription-repair coupling factor (superfamily II helicase)
LTRIAELRIKARSAGLTQLIAQGKYIRLAPCALAESQQLWLQRVVKGTIFKPATRIVLVPVPKTGLAASGLPAGSLDDSTLTGVDLVDWLSRLIDDLTARRPGAAGGAADGGAGGAADGGVSGGVGGAGEDQSGAA